MKKWLDKLESTAFRLRDRCKEVVRNAPENFEKAKPVIQENIDKVREELGDAITKAKPSVKEGFEKVADTTRAAYEKAKPAIETGLDKLVNVVEKTAAEFKKENTPAESAEAESPESAEKPGRPLTVDERIDVEVDEQVDKIRASQITPTSISEFIAQKYGKKKD